MCVCSEIAAGNYTDETTIPGYSVKFFPNRHGDVEDYEDMSPGNGLHLSHLSY